jgi:acetyltransferase-like isoleucine patch superfamily enzyme
MAQSMIKLYLLALLDGGFLYNFLGNIKFRLLGVSFSKVYFQGAVDVKRTSDSKISMINGTFIGNNQIWARDGGTIQIGNNFWCENNIRLNSPKGCLKIGNNVRIGAFTIINSFENITIGDNSLISSHVHIIDADHGTSRNRLIGSQKMDSGAILIGSDVWIGNGVVILRGVTIGEGAIIGANSVVTKDIPPYSIAIGAPAKVLRQRD